MLRDAKSTRAIPPAILLLTAVLLSPVGAQDTPPDLKGVWSGVARSVVVGSGYHHPGNETDKEAPRVREVRFTYTVRGQDDRLVHSLVLRYLPELHLHLQGASG